MDPPSGVRKNGSGKISFGIVKYYLESFGPAGIAVAPKEVVQSRELGKKPVASADVAPVGMTQE